MPAFPPAPNQRAVTRRQRVGAVAAQVLFYGLFAVPLVAAAWFATANAPFALAVAATAAAIVALAIHVHDAVHCPGHSPLERFGWFWFLDRHHYVHHVDTQANTNFLLPLGDLLLGTLRREAAPRRAEALADLRRGPRGRPRPGDGRQPGGVAAGGPPSGG